MIEIIGNLAFQLPDFKHEIGDAYHHQSLMRTVERDEDGDYIPWTGNMPPNWRIEIHEILDAYIFYPISGWINKYVGDARPIHHILKGILGFFWGFNCCFPRKDVVLYTAWYFHGCPAVRVWEKNRTGWVIS